MKVFKTALVAAMVAMLIGGSAAEASRLITGKQIKDNSITGRDI